MLEKRIDECKISGRPLPASEVRGDEKMSVVHFLLGMMLRKNLVEIVDFVKRGNIFGICYQPIYLWKI